MKRVEKMEILDQIKQNSIHRAEQIAIVCGEDTISYRELHDRIEYLSYIIEQKLPHSNEAIAIISERSIEFIIGMLAVLNTGNYYIPIEKPIPEDRVNYILTNSRVKIVLSDCDDCFENIININIKTIFENSEMISYCSSKKDMTRIAYAIYTSGTTGKPKGAKIRYESLCNLIKALGTIFGEESQYSNVAVVASFSFDSSIKQIYGSLYYGRRLIIAQKKDKIIGRKLVSFFERNNVELTDITPSYLEIIMSSKRIPCVKRYLVGGEKVKSTLVKQFTEYIADYLDISLFNMYGPTECCVDVAVHEIDFDNDLKDTYVPVGKALENVELEIYNHSGIVKNNSVQGELYVFGIQVGDGYIEDVKENANFINLNGRKCYKTGDIAFYNENGNIVVLGRQDEQIKIHGNRVELGEIESAINSIIGADKSCVIFDENKQKIICFLTQNVNRKDIVAELKNIVPAYMCPQKYIEVQELPITTSGKIDKKGLYDYYITI